MSSAIGILLTNTNYKPQLDRANLNPIGGNAQSNILVDMLLNDYQDLIEPKFRAWFALKLKTIPFDQIHRYASESRQEGRNPKRLFAYKVAHFTTGI